MKLKDVRLTPLSYSKNTFSIKIPIQDKYDNKKQIRAFMPNVIHSLDAVSLVLLVDSFFNLCNSSNKNIYAVHDCFAVTANNVIFVMNRLKWIYTHLYSDEKFLIKLNKDTIHNIKNHYGEDSFDEENLIIYVKNNKKPIKYPDVSKFLRGNLNKVKFRKPKKYPDVGKVVKGDLNIQDIKKSSYILS
jgi:DNA-directed RNA polymerase